MCGPVGGILSMAVGGMQQIASFNAAEEDARAQDAVWLTNYNSALSAGRDKQAALGLRQIQEGESLTEADRIAQLEAAKAEGATLVEAEGAGLGGLSVDSLVRDVISTSAFNRSIERTNFDNRAAQLQLEKKGVNAEIADRVNSVSKGRHPSKAGLFLGLAGTALQGAGGMM